MLMATRQCPDCDCVKVFALAEGDGKCSNCHGSGEYSGDPVAFVLGGVDCEECDSSGVCPTCDGEGVIEDEDDEG
jgi:DnaJ-class molecular chaperone